MRVHWHCSCGSHNNALYPIKKDLSSAVATGQCFGLGQLDLFKTQVDTIEAVGIRKCKQCKQPKALIFYSEHPFLAAFSYALDSDIGKKVVELLKKRRADI